MMRYLMLVIALAAAAFFHHSHALALGSGDVAVVVEVLERLVPERGEAVYYDEEAAADWYEFDQDGPQLLAAGDFTLEAWCEAYDNTLKGLIALLPEAEYGAIHAGIDEKVSAIPGLDDERRSEIIAEWHQHVARFDALRQEGRAYASVVQPFALRLRRLTDF